MGNVQSPDFLNFCVEHGYLLHDGSKDVCCTNGKTIPMLTSGELERHQEKVQTAFSIDFQALAECAAKNDSMPKIVKPWFDTLLVEMHAKQPEKAAEESEGVEGEMTGGEDEQSDEENYYQAVYLKGWESGFDVGFAKGFDLALSISKQNGGKK